MINYEQMYKVLFNGVTDALRDLERGNWEAARVGLEESQLRAEEIFIEGEGEGGVEL